MANDSLMRVLFVDHTAQLGGGEIALRNLLDNLDLRRVHVEVLLCANGPLTGQLSERYSVRILPLSQRVIETRKDTLGFRSFLRLHYFEIPLYAARLSRLIRKLKIDIVHTNSLKAHVIGGLAGRVAGRPVIWHMRDRIAPDYLPRAAVKFIRMLCRVIPTRIIANSQATLNTIVALDGQSRPVGLVQRISRVVHDGCTIPSTSVAPDWNSAVLIGLIGRISPWKGQHVFVKAAALIGDEFPAARFQIIGAPLFSENAYEEELRALCAKLGIQDRVEFTGFVEGVQGAIERLNIVVHASTIGEPFGQVIIEGMAAGRPVIATNGGGVPEIVEDNVTGLLIPPNDERSLADAMRRLLRDPDTAEEMGRRGRERAREFFNLQRTARSVEQIYTEVMGDRNARGGQLKTMVTKRIDG